MGIISAAKKLLKRNYAMADMYMVGSGQPIYSTFTIAKAVKEGYKASPTVYRAIFLITKSAASVPWIVYSADNEPMPDHYLTKMLQHPNPNISKQDLFELIISWLLLAGNSYMKKTKVGNKTNELWPISPDRLAVVPSKDIEEWLKGYALDKSGMVDYEPSEIIHMKFFNPANPLIGISPLEAVSKTVDVDVDQQKWNKSAMQNRGVLDGIVSVDREITSQKQADELSDALNESVSGTKNARRLRVFGSNAKYFRTARSPIEMDFNNSRKENRNEIYITFGVPPQYAGVQESSTYNNYQASEIIFWVGTVLPILDDVADAMTFSLQDELEPGQRISYNKMAIQAIRGIVEGKAKAALYLFRMGVPFNQINGLFQFGAKEFEGWDKSYVGGLDIDADPSGKDDPTAVRDIEEMIKKKVRILK